MNEIPSQKELNLIFENNGLRKEINVLKKYLRTISLYAAIMGGTLIFLILKNLYLWLF
jgi:hypothetical protein